VKSRRSCREAALQALYQFDTLGEFSPETFQLFLDHFQSQAELDDAAPESRLIADQFCHELVHGVVLNIELIDQQISRASAHWSLSRMARVDRNILRIATFELLFCEDVPPKVSINEAIEIAKRFSAPDATTFINGVLDTIAGDRSAPNGAKNPRESEDG